MNKKYRLDMNKKYKLNISHKKEKVNSKDSNKQNAPKNDHLGDTIPPFHFLLKRLGILLKLQ